MTTLYTEKGARGCQRRAGRSLIAAFALVLVAWAVCVFLCTRVRTANAGQMFRWVLALSIVSGWAAIALLILVYRPARAEGRHIEGLLSEETEEMRGVLTVDAAAFQIPRGIRVYRARLETEDGPVSLRLSARVAEKVPRGAPIRVTVRRQFITGFEVEK